MQVFPKGIYLATWEIYMDPQIALWELLSAYHRGDRQQIDECLSNLRCWNKGEGFMPTVQGRYVTGVENMVYIVTSKSKAPTI
jgi:hypothetical protein